MMQEGLLAFTVRELTHIRRPGKKAFQKLIYFVQAKGVPLSFRYGIHLFGPYSEKLATFVEAQVFEGTLAYESDGPSVLVVPGPGSHFAIEENLEAIDRYRDAITSVLETLGARNPANLELLSTTHFVAWQHQGSQEDLIHKVYKVKGGKFSQDAIATAVGELRELGYLSGTPFH